MSVSSEIPLTGGRTTTGVVRIGQTVRRPVGSNSEYVHRALRHLEKAGFDAAPRFLGIDAKGREVLTYLAGDVPEDLGFWDLAVLTEAARLIRRFHDATAESEVAVPYEIVCHGDLSPCNTVFVAGTPCFLIDFDAAHPGQRIRDVAYASWLWLDIGNEDYQPQVQAFRLQHFLQAYGGQDASDLIEAMIMRQTELQHDANERGWHDTAAWAHACQAWVRRYAQILKRMSV